MEEKEIDYVVADDLQAGDLINVTGKVQAVVKRLEDYSDQWGDYIKVLCEDDEEYVFEWDDKVTLYGY